MKSVAAIGLGIQFFVLVHVVYADHHTYGETYFVEQLGINMTVSDSVMKDLYGLASPSVQPVRKKTRSKLLKKRPLFKNYKKLSDHISLFELADLPTPVQPLQHLGEVLSLEHLYIKRDDLTGLLLDNGHRLFGGNKIRKLEILLGDALFHNARTILTVGSAGSNMAVATAAACDYAGLKSIVLLKPQPSSSTVKRNLLLMDYYGAQIQVYPTVLTRSMGVVDSFFRNKNEYGNMPYFIPAGGSVPMGIIGYVNAVFELQEQIKKRVCPKPDYMYVATSSFGTAAGLLLGLKLTGLSSRLVAVVVVTGMTENECADQIISLAHKTNMLLHTADAAVPLVACNRSDIHVTNAQVGKEYGLVTPQAHKAIALMKETERIQLDVTYTGKALAALIDDAQHGKLKGKVVLFWDTFCGNDVSELLKGRDYKKLPKTLWSYFE